MKKLFLVTILAGLMAASSAKASFTFNVSGSGLSAQAEITPGAGTITVVLNNLQTGIVSSGQALSGIQFNVSGVSSGSLGTSFSGETINIASSSDPYTIVNATDPLNHWTAGLSAGSILLATVPGTGGKPNQMIMGPDNGSGVYDTVNNGFVQNGGFNPYVHETATFILSNPDFTANTVISDVAFRFGTGPDAILTPIPEASTVIAGLLLLLPLGASTIRILRQERKV